MPPDLLRAHQTLDRAVAAAYAYKDVPTDAARVAFKAMVRWVRDRTGMSEMEAHQFVSQTSRAPIIQLVDPEYTVMVKLEKRRLHV